MIYTLFVWSVVAALPFNTNNYTNERLFYEWRPLAQVETFHINERDNDVMLAKCAGVARELNIPRERYRCIRTK